MCWVYLRVRSAFSVEYDAIGHIQDETDGFIQLVTALKLTFRLQSKGHRRTGLRARHRQRDQLTITPTLEVARWLVAYL